MGELHLEIIVDRLLREFKVEANVGKPQVAYRETITADGRAGRASSSARPAAAASTATSGSRVEPAEPGKGFEFVNKIIGGVDPAGSTSRPSRRASRRRAESGVLAGYPVVDVKVTLLDGSYHEVDSSEMAFKIAGSMAFKDGCAKAEPDPARADHGRRGGRPRGLHGRRHRAT